MSLTRIKTMYDIVKLLLQNNINMRDDDNLLVSKIWGFTLVDMDIKPSQHTMTLFLQILLLVMEVHLQIILIVLYL